MAHVGDYFNKKSDFLYAGDYFNKKSDFLYANFLYAGEKSFAGILSRYDRENPLVERDLVVHSMGLALAGWMAIDPGNASKGFRELIAGTNHE